MWLPRTGAGATDRFPATQRPSTSGEPRTTARVLFEVSDGPTGRDCSSLIRSSPYYADMCVAIESESRRTFARRPVRRAV